MRDRNIHYEHEVNEVSCTLYNFKFKFSIELKYYTNLRSFLAYHSYTNLRSFIPLVAHLPFIDLFAFNGLSNAALWQPLPCCPCILKPGCDGYLRVLNAISIGKAHLQQSVIGWIGQRKFSGYIHGHARTPRSVIGVARGYQ